MPDSREFDVKYLSNLELPYDVTTKELSDASPRIVAGSNTYITLGGKIAQAPGLAQASSSFSDKRPDRVVSYETLENPPKIYIVGSFYAPSTGKWSVSYIRIDGSNTWTSLGSYRDLDTSTRAHEISCAGGKCYIKGFPTGDKIGSVVFDGSGSGTVGPWGIVGPTDIDAHDAAVYPWAASTDPITVLYGWQYAVCYESPTGQLSNHNPIIVYAATYPGQYHGDTGPFVNFKPAILMYVGEPIADTPYLQIFRTTDGGGTFYFLDRVAHTGAVTQTYVDNKRSVSNTNNSKLDSQLDLLNIAPSEVSNTVPPPVSKGKVIGTDNVEPSTNIAYYARRFWYAIGNRLYFSGQEEILNGIPEESFPSPNGIIGNFYTFQGQIRWVCAAKRGLYVGTSNEIIYITGQDRANFFPDSVVPDVSAATGHPHSVVAFRDSIFFLSSDLQIYAITGAQAPTLISGPLGSTLRDAIVSGVYQCSLEIFSRDGLTLLFVNLADQIVDGSATSKQLVYDLERQMWFTPWSKSISAMTFGRLKESDPQKHLICLTWNDISSAGITTLDPTITADLGVSYVPAFTTNLFTVPAGNHINELRKHGHFPVVSYLLTERTKFSSDHEPTVTYRLDEFSGSATTGTASDPPFSAQHSSHIDKWYPIHKACQRVQLSVTGTAGEKFEIQNLGFIFQSEAGA